MVKKYLILFLVIASFGCGKKASFESQRWSIHSGQQPPQLENVEAYKDIKKQTKVLKVSDQQVLRAPQRIEGIEVEGTWYQEVKSPKGELISVSYKFAYDIDKSIVAQAHYIEATKEEIIKKAKAQFPNLDHEGEIADKHTILVESSLGVQPFLKVTVLYSNENRIVTYYLNSAGRVKKTSINKHDFTDGIGVVYSSAPTESELKSEPLRNLKGDGVLASDHLSIESAISPTPFSQNNIFQFQVDDREFDILQAYYFVDQTMGWFEDELGVKLNSSLNIKLHIGGLKPTNAAFFYAGNIRLGEGDGVIYEHIPRDPSIVGHEAAHAYVEYLSGLSFEGEPGSYSEAFSDFFTAIRLGRPEMGFYAYKKADYKRTIDNDMKANKDFNGGKYNDSLIISGTFWDIKKILGSEKTARLAKYFLIELGPGGKISDLPDVLTSVAHQHLLSEDWHVIESVLEQRGWRN
ncbi:MAG: hypothetical protein KDD34_02120 [Bdellovibrionales bacterium]|nr:hypothetical protein [Bdellovibrionales bacterium]